MKREREHLQNDGRYEILNVIGPDEYKEDVDNNVYTNYMAYFNLASARDIFKFIHTGSA